jgi:hypothetical protein
MKKSLVLAISILALATVAGTARAADLPAKQEGRVWIYQNFVLAFSPNWSLTTMPGGRVEYARTREGKAGMQLIEWFFGPNYTYKTGNWTIKGSLWYYYMGYPQRGREVPGKPATSDCSAAPMGSSPNCTSLYNFSHNLEIIPSVEYRLGRWSFYDRIILHNTFYADVYSTPNAALGLSVADQRLGLGTVLRELVQVRFAVTDRLGVSLMDEVFFGLKEDSDTSKVADGKGYSALGYWKRGFRSNRIYAGIDYKVTPNFTLAPMYMVDMTMNTTDSADVTDIAHNFYMVATVTAATFGGK